MLSEGEIREIQKIRELLFSHLEREEWKGWDPFDALASPHAARWVRDSRPSPLKRGLGIALLQGVKRSPVNLRPLLKIPKLENAMSWAVAILGGSEAGERGHAESSAFLQKAASRLIALADPKTGLWGYPFPWAARAFFLKANTPNLVLSGLALKALAEIVSIKNGAAEEARRQIRKAVPSFLKLFYKPREGYFSYVAHEPVLVHNANLFGLEALAHAVAAGCLEQQASEPTIRTALEKTVKAQEFSGRWPYGEKPHHQWCDNFHTAYNLMSLAALHALRPDPRAAEAIRRGIPFYLQHAFTAKGDPRYFDKKTWPVETHGAAVALIFLRRMSEGGWIGKEAGQALAEKIWRELRRKGYLGNGRFIYRRGRFFRNKTVFNRWTQSWMYYALECLLNLYQ